MQKIIDIKIEYKQGNFNKALTLAIELFEWFQEDRKNSENNIDSFYKLGCLLVDIGDSLKNFDCITKGLYIFDLYENVYKKYCTEVCIEYNKGNAKKAFFEYKKKKESYHTRKKLYHSIFERISSEYTLRTFVSYFSEKLGIVIVFFSILVSPLTLVYAFRKRKYLILFLLLIIAQQASINSFAFHYRCYTSNVYFFMLINLVFGLYIIYISINKKLLKN